jgi:hypothetical protein
MEFAELNFQNPAASILPYCKTHSPWIPFPAIQNHSMDVSSELGLLRSNGFGAMLVKDTTNMAQKLNLLS